MGLSSGGNTVTQKGVTTGSTIHLVVPTLSMISGTAAFADGTNIEATVKEVVPEAQRLPPERVAPLAPRGQSIVVELQSDTPLPARYWIHYLPLDVRFEHVWSLSD